MATATASSRLAQSEATPTRTYACRPIEGRNRISRERIHAAADGAQLLVGHSARLYDAVQLQRQYPALRCLTLPVLVTLELSAIAFPTKPYHRLVKGYKLLSDTRNDPVRDARLSLDLLVDELEALAEMERVDADWVKLLHIYWPTMPR